MLSTHFPIKSVSFSWSSWSDFSDFALTLKSHLIYRVFISEFPLLPSPVCVAKGVCVVLQFRHCYAAVNTLTALVSLRERKLLACMFYCPHSCCLSLIVTPFPNCDTCPPCLLPGVWANADVAFANVWKWYVCLWFYSLLVRHHATDVSIWYLGWFLRGLFPRFVSPLRSLCLTVSIGRRCQECKSAGTTA
jgi:hypothetical protein